MYKKYLDGLDCRQGLGMYDIDQQLDFEQIPNGVLVIVQGNGVHIKSYEFRTIFKGTMLYKEQDGFGKKGTKTLTFSIRKNKFGKGINLVINDQNEVFHNFLDFQRHLNERYGRYIISDDWRVYYEGNANFGFGDEELSR